MSTISTSVPLRSQLEPVGPDRPKSSRWKSKLVNHSKLYLVLFALLAPTLVGMIVFNYYPKFSAIKYSFYEWDGQLTEDWVGWKNFTDLLQGRDALFWPTFQLVGILLVTNLVKMWPSIFCAIVLHRVRSERWQYLYRVLFVVPMVIPSLVWLLIWKGFFDPNVGIFNKMLNATGLMALLNRLDTLMPWLAHKLTPAVTHGANPLFGSVWGMLAAGAMVLTMLAGARGLIKAWVWWMILLPSSWLLWGDQRTFLLVPLIIVVGALLAARPAGRAVLKWTGGLLVALGCGLVIFTMIWYVPTRQFTMGNPSWLSHEKLVIPALILWGFPWIGTIGVLIYLAGLQSISQDVYEAAELDGVSSLGRMFRIELPLMMTQVRINLIFMTIGTLSDYGLILLLLGPNGGPKSVGMTPGLYMYKTAFIDARFGFACALGMVLFVLILAITVIYQRYVKVDK